MICDITPPLGKVWRGRRDGVYEVGMMWFLFQSSIIFAVMASNIHWGWTPNPYLAGLIGVVLAYGLTSLINAIRPSTYGRSSKLPRRPPLD